MKAKRLTLSKRLTRTVDRWLHHGVTEIALLVLIAISVIVTVVEVLLPEGSAPWLEFAGTGLTVLFAIELTLRFLVAPKKTRFFERYWIDILAVLPIVRPLRLFRILRVLRLFRAGVLFRRRVVGFTHGTLTQSGEALALVIGTVALVLISATVLLVVEGPTNDRFDEVSEVLWFATYSLIGGEPIGGEPVSDIGRWTTMMLMLGGLTIFGVFVASISASMVNRLRGQMELHELHIDELEGHVVICGWNHSVRTVLRELFGPGTPPERCVVLVTEVPVPDEALLLLPEVRPEHLYRETGDFTREAVLIKMGIERAESIILMADDLVKRSDQDTDARTVLAALTVERMAPEIYTVAELHSRQSEEFLRLSGVEDVVVADWYSGMILGSVQRNRGLVRVLDDILTQSHGNAFQTWTVPAAWHGKTVEWVHSELYVRHRAVLVSVEAGEQLVVNPEPDMTLSENQRIVVIAAAGVKPL